MAWQGVSENNFALYCNSDSTRGANLIFRKTRDGKVASAGDSFGTITGYGFDVNGREARSTVEHFKMAGDPGDGFIPSDWSLSTTDSEGVLNHRLETDVEGNTYIHRWVAETSPFNLATEAPSPDKFIRNRIFYAPSGSGVNALSIPGLSHFHEMLPRAKDNTTIQIFVVNNGGQTIAVHGSSQIAGSITIPNNSTRLIHIVLDFTNNQRIII